MAAAVSRVVRRGSRFYFRAAVPLALVALVGQRELKLSLRTCCLSEAKLRGRVLSNAADLFFAGLRKMPKLTPQDVRQRIRDYFQVALNQCQEHALLLPLDDALDIEQEVASLREYVEGLRKQLAAQSFTENVTSDARTALNPEGSPKPGIDHDTMLLACNGVLRAQIERARILGAMLSGNYEGTAPSDPLFKGMEPNGLPPLYGEKPPMKPEPLTVAIMAQRYCDFNAHTWVQKTALDQRRVLSLSCTLIDGDKPIAALGTDDVKAVRDALARIPPNYMKANTNKGATVADVIAVNKTGPTLSLKTQDKYLSMFRSFLIWAVNEGYIDKMPGQGVKVAGVGKLNPADMRHPYSTDQLNAIFSAPLYRGHDGSPARTHPGAFVARDGKFWVPIIALFSGMRMGEIVQLLASDLREENGIWFFDITKGEDKKLKTASSKRRVPVHGVLLDLGILKLKGSTKGRLFPDIEPGKDGYHSHNFSKWWGRYSKHIGFAAPKTAFHSFRHNFVDGLRAAELPEYVNKALLGHSDKEVHGHYGSGPPLSLLKASVDKVAYPIDFSFLRE